MLLDFDKFKSNAPVRRQPALWHVLGVSSIPVNELAISLHRFVPTNIWVPKMRLLGIIFQWARSRISEETGQKVWHFSLQRGYTQPFLEKLLRPSKRIRELLMDASPSPEDSVLVCTSPFWVPVAEMWLGPVIYYATDLTAMYSGLNRSQVEHLDTKLCRIATLVCPNSQSIAEYMRIKAGCRPEIIRVIPNATRASNIRISSDGPSQLPDDVADLTRPVAGIIGNLAGNIDWELLSEAIDLVPKYTWLLIGSSSMQIEDRHQRAARTKVLTHHRVRNIGFRPYITLQKYARALDVAVLPYSSVEPTRLGSSTRFYEHLAACRPMIATRGVNELLSKIQFLTLINTAEELASELKHLQNSKNDYREEVRRLASVNETWDERAKQMIAALREMQQQSRGPRE